jgi:hypothetical protein
MGRGNWKLKYRSNHGLNLRDKLPQGTESTTLANCQNDASLEMYGYTEMTDFK